MGRGVGGAVGTAEGEYVLEDYDDIKRVYKATQETLRLVYKAKQETLRGNTQKEAGGHQGAAAATSSKTRGTP